MVYQTASSKLKEPGLTSRVFFSFSKRCEFNFSVNPLIIRPVSGILALVSWSAMAAKRIFKTWLNQGGACSVPGLERDSHQLTSDGEPVGQAEQRQ